ncbi:hypothetical protein BDA99DRAFT_232249 [Phascolomyces articulosus]|uniref:Fanconi-associated nuclease n=1 Tax=Phascolomyces articulosus TaxID=60185 RepID=A0AAD5JZJ3_9FUNG|nr:hypothetical protein BDA99DRAFT_232249 [Phascolomyces articulosus]
METKRSNKKIKLNNDPVQKKLDFYFISPKPSNQLAVIEEQNDKKEKLDQEHSPLSPTPTSTSTTTATPISNSSMSDVSPNEGNEKQESFYESSMYTDEFNSMLATVLDGEQFLFTPTELKVFHTYQYEINGDAKHLYVRLWMRKKRRWIRIDKLKANNKHVRDLKAAAQQLREHGLTSKHEIPIEDALELLSVDELKQIAPCRAANRAEYITTIRTQCNTSEIRRRVGYCILLDEHIHGLFHRVHLVYYRLTVLEEENPMTAAILARISRRNYPDYVTCRTTTVWTSRDDLLAYEQALKVELQFEEQNLKAKIDHDQDLLLTCWELCENHIGLWEDMLKERHNKDDYSSQGSFFSRRPYSMRQFEACRVYTRLLDHGTQVLAKLHEYDLEAIMLRKLLAQKVYRLAKRGCWYDRLALVQSKKQDRKAKKEALATCIKGIQDPTVHSIDLHRLHRRIHRLERDLAIPKREQLDFSYLQLRKPQERIIYGERISESVSGFKSIWRADDGAECSVEALSLDYYKKQGYTQGYHTEGGMISMLFILLFWDIVFAPMDGVFETSYQSAPLDMGSDAFYAGNKSQGCV